jgi:hypothetical protein
MMAEMRAILVLATILSFATPNVSWTPRDHSPTAAASMSMAAPAAVPQLVRGIAKIDKTFGFGAAFAADVPALFPPAESIELRVALAHAPPNLHLTEPPLAPRPPPES